MDTYIDVIRSIQAEKEERIFKLEQLKAKVAHEEEEIYDMDDMKEFVLLIKCVKEVPQIVHTEQELSRYIESLKNQQESQVFEQDFKEFPEFVQDCKSRLVIESAVVIVDCWSLDKYWFLKWETAVLSCNKKRFEVWEDQMFTQDIRNDPPELGVTKRVFIVHYLKWR